MIYLYGEEMNDIRIKNISLKNVSDYLETKTINQFTGSVRLSFEFGKLVAINEANQHDILTDKADDSVVAKYLKLASDPLFSGHLSFVFLQGKVTNYSYSKTLKGDTLKKFFFKG